MTFTHARQQRHAARKSARKQRQAARKSARKQRQAARRSARKQRQGGVAYNAAREARHQSRAARYRKGGVEMKEREAKRRQSKQGGNPAFQGLALPLSLYAASTMVDQRSLRDYTRKKNRKSKRR